MRRLVVLLILLSLSATAPAASRKKPPARRRPVAAKSTKSTKTKKPVRPAAYRGPWTAPTFADSTFEDNVDGEDLDVRRAAVAALGPYHGTVVVTDPQNGRVLSIVNQKLALEGGYQPCSTVKLVTTLAALQEELIPQTSQAHSTLINAMARSTNWYFATLGQKLGFERVLHHARLLGLGEKAGWDIPGEQSGLLPSAAPRDGGVGKMTSFGSGISLTPLGLAALVGAVANGGTLHYLQYPRTPAEIAGLTPRIKRELAIGNWIGELKRGMRAAVERGTARRAAVQAEEPIYGKTGTCTDFGKGAHMGWFGSFNEVGDRKLVVVVMLAGARGVSGPVASGIAGKVYAELARRNFTLRAARAARYPNS
jgi:cell division protein FtsI/penicillin-binding protein 2